MAQRNTISASLKELLEVGLLERNGPNSPVYRFKNDTVRDVTYMRMLFTQRQQLHEKIALFFEDLRESSGDRQLTLSLAHHWRMAVLNNPDVGARDNLPKVVSYVMTAAALFREEDNFEEARMAVRDAEKIANLIPDDGNLFHQEEKAMLVQACQKQLEDLDGKLFK